MKEEKKVEVKQQQQSGEKKVDLVRDTNNIKDYYGAWDKFNVDTELQKLEQEEQRAYRAYNPYEDSKNYKRAKPKVKVNVKGRRNIVSDPSELKDKVHIQIFRETFISKVYNTRRLSTATVSALKSFPMKI